MLDSLSPNVPPTQADEKSKIMYVVRTFPFVKVGNRLVANAQTWRRLLDPNSEAVLIASVDMDLMDGQDTLWMVVDETACATSPWT